ncbi:unnamed protein product [Microthlaspi erraticum]|uniref:Neprosin PEP catalytic domain-containing protein n=1 Tax=Microthlaspi erraticum TaxID=1685480 RepID=A0A6D2L3B9_9BRAS|nr:unnamed protein product [Microthlaspi erraticum]
MMSHSFGIVKATETLKFFEDLEIEKKLKLINKPAVKIIKSIYGERYGCVDFYKQPGFDHSSMMNHTSFHSKMRMMSLHPEGSKLQRGTLGNKKFGYFWENGIGCPNGTVPILRATKGDLFRLKSFGGENLNPQSSWNNTYEPMSAGSGYHFAVVRTNGPKSYNGAYMNVRICTPPVQPNQRSSARMMIRFGNEFIQAGWTAGGHACYHTRCPSGAGMIQVRQDFGPGLPLRDKYATLDIAIMKDKSNATWSLYVAGEEIGYWPSSRFKVSSGTMVEWGGAVYSPPSSPSPMMGTGRFPTGNPNIDSYIRLISIVDGDYKEDKTVTNRYSYSDNNHAYKVTDATETFYSYTGHIIFYGGPGGI